MFYRTVFLTIRQSGAEVIPMPLKGSAQWFKNALFKLFFSCKKIVYTRAFFNVTDRLARFNVLPHCLFNCKTERCRITEIYYFIIWETVVWVRCVSLYVVVIYFSVSGVRIIWIIRHLRRLFHSYNSDYATPVHFMSSFLVDFFVARISSPLVAPPSGVAYRLRNPILHIFRLLSLGEFYIFFTINFSSTVGESLIAIASVWRFSLNGFPLYKKKLSDCKGI